MLVFSPDENECQARIFIPWHGAVFIRCNNAAMGNRIREFRKAKGLTLEDLGARVGMGAGHLSRLERGEVSYTQERLETIARELECRPADLIDDRPPLSPAQKSMVNLLDTLTPEEQDRLVKMAKVYADPVRSPASSDDIEYRQPGFRDPPTLHEARRQHTPRSK